MLSLRGSIQSSLKLSRQTRPRPNERKEGTWNGYPRPRGPCQLPTRLAPHRRPASGVRPLSRSPSLPNFPPPCCPPRSVCPLMVWCSLRRGELKNQALCGTALVKLDDCLVHISANARKARVWFCGMLKKCCGIRFTIPYRSRTSRLSREPPRLLSPPWRPAQTLTPRAQGSCDKP
jgi:hypothetical protein